MKRPLQLRDGCSFDIRNIDLPRKAKYRPRYKPELKVDRGCRVGRIIMIMKYIWNSIRTQQWCRWIPVIGSKGRKSPVDDIFVKCVELMLIFAEATLSKSVIDIYDELYHRLGGQDFRKLFPVILDG